MSKKKITFANSFAKDLKKLPNSLANDHKIDVLRKQLLKKNEYLPYWRKILDISYNKHDTLVLAKALCNLKPSLSLWQAKLIVSESPWFDYRWFNDSLIKLNNPELAKKVDQLFDYIYDMGKTHYLKINTPEYEKALDDWFNKAMDTGTDNDDGSFTLGSPKEDPILIVSEKERAIAKKEVAEEQNELGQLITDWIKNDRTVQTTVIAFLRVWAKNYRHHGFNANWRIPTNQMEKARRNIINHNWNDLPNQFSQMLGWWD